MYSEYCIRPSTLNGYRKLNVIGNTVVRITKESVEYLRFEIWKLRFKN